MFSCFGSFLRSTCNSVVSIAQKLNNSVQDAVNTPQEESASLPAGEKLRSRTSTTWRVLQSGAALATLGALCAPMAAFAGSAKTTANVRNSVPEKGAKQSIVKSLNDQPLHFEPNRGQADSRVRYMVHAAGMTSYITDRENVMVLSRQKSFSKQVEQAVVRMKLDGMQTMPAFEGLDKTGSVVNYYMGSERSKWVTGVPTYAKIAERGIYNGIDLVYYGDGRKLEFDFVVKPGADPKQIQMSYDGADSLTTDKDGNLLIATKVGTLLQHKPRVYQEIAGKRSEIETAYTVQGGKVELAVAKYDRDRDLVIDPVLEYATVLGGNSDAAYGIAVDGSGNAYVTGTTLGNFPTTAGVFQGSYSATPDSNAIFVTKLNPANGNVIYSTYIGGTGYAWANGIAVDGSGNAYITGNANGGFPTTSSNAYLATVPDGKAQSAILVKLDQSGANLLYSTYLGVGSSAYGIALDNSGNAYITGSAGAGLPVTSGAYQGVAGGNGSNAFVAKLNTNVTGASSLVYSSYLGGNSDNSGGTGIAVDGSDNVYVTGYTGRGFTTTSGVYQPNYGGTPTPLPGTGSGSNAFVAKLNPSVAGAAGLVYATYLGGEGSDQGKGIAVDAAGNAYVAGSTNSALFPTTTGAFQGTPTTAGHYHAFAAKLNPAGTGLLYSTYLGGSSSEFGAGIAVDASGSIYVSGTTSSDDYPATVGAYQTALAGPKTSDAFVTKLNPAGTGASDVLYSSYLGGGGGESENGIVLDASGSHVYLVGSTSSSDFPTTSNAMQGVLSSGGTGSGAYLAVLDMSTAVSSPGNFAAHAMRASPRLGACPPYTGPPAIRNLAGFSTNVLPANDDGFTPEVTLGWPAADTLNLWGNSYTGLYVNNNGNVTFDSGSGTFTPSGILGATTKIIAPFWADVDTRGAGSGLVHWGTDTVDIGGGVMRPAFGVEWPAVGYFNSKVDKRDTFELVLIDRNDTGQGNFDIEFNYGSMQWETGDASSGVNGMGGSNATAGYSNGLAGAANVSYSVPGSGPNNGTSGYLLDGGVDALNTTSYNTCVPGRQEFNARNGSIGTISLASSANPSNYTSPVTFTATVPPPATGTVTFQDGGVNIVGCISVPVVSVTVGAITTTTATCGPISTLSVGTHTIASNYSGDVSYTAASTSISQVVNLIPTTTTVTRTAGTNPSTYGSSVTYQATISPSVTGGTVSFTSDGVAIAGCTSVAVSSNTATCSTSALTITNGTGTDVPHTILATYTPDSTHSGSSGSIPQSVISGTAATLTFTVQPTNTQAGASISPAVVVHAVDAGGNPVMGTTITLTLQGGSATLNGTITAYTDLNGNATFSGLNIQTVGTYTLKATATPGSATATSSSFNITALTGNVLIVPYSGNNQAAVTGTAYAAPLQVQVTDAFGNPINNATVTFTAPASGASVSLSGSTATTNANGLASVTATANSATGSFIVSATTSGAPSPANFNLQNIPVGSNKLAFVVQPTNTAAGANITPAVTVQLQTSAGASLAIAGVPVTLQIIPGTTGGPGVLSGTVTALTNASGLATFNTLSIAQIGTGYKLEATSPNTVSVVSSAFNITAGTAAHITIVSGNPQSAQISTAFAQPLIVKVTDAGNNPVSGTAVTFAVVPVGGASATLSPASGITTNASGLATVTTATANGTAGSYTVTATAGSAGSVTFNLTNTTTAPDKMTFTVQPSNTSAGNSISPAVTVRYVDGSGNPVANKTITVALAGGTLATLGGTATGTTDANGNVSFPALNVNLVGTGYQLVAVSGQISATSSAFNITTGISGDFIRTQSGNGQTTTVATAFASQLVAIVEDAFNNPVSGSTVTFVRPASGASATLTTPAVTNASGLAMVTATANTTAGGPYYVTATATGAGGSASYMLTNTVGTTLTITATTGTPQSATVNTAFSTALQATVTDQYGNPVPNATVTFTAPGTGASAVFVGATTVTTNAAGLAWTNVSANTTAGTYNVTAATSGAATPATFALTNLAGTTNMAITVASGTSQTTAIGTAFGSSLVATVKDQYGNVVPNITITFTPPASGASATLSSTSGTSNTSGQVTIATATANLVVGTYNVVASATNATSANFALTNIIATPGAMTFTVQPSNTQAGASISPAVVVHVVDTGSNPAIGVPVTLALQGGSATLNGTLTVYTDLNGNATFPDLNIQTVGTYTLKATTTSAVTATSSSFNITALTGNVLITTYSGNNQSAVIGTLYAAPLQVRVTDAFGNPISGATVTFTAPASGASAALTAAATTDAYGFTSVTATANATVGSFIVSATTSGAPSPANFNLQNIPVGSNKLVFVAQPQNTAAGATMAAVTVQLQTSGGANISVAGVPITLQLIPGTTGPGTLSGTVTALTNASGLATFNTLSIAQIGTGYKLEATSPNTVSVVSSAFNITAGTAAHITIVSGNPQSAQISTAFAQPLIVKVTDAGNNPVSGTAVTFAVVPVGGASATLSPASGITTNASGLATVTTATANGTAGSYTVTATAGSAGSVTFNLTNTTTAPDKMTFTVQPSNTPAGNSIIPAVTVRYVDGSGNPVANKTITVALAGGTLATLGGTATGTTDANGNVSFPTLNVDLVGTGYQLVAVSGQISATSSAFNITTGISGDFIRTQSGNGQTTTVATAFTSQLVAIVEDAFNNPVSGSTVTFVTPASGASATLTTPAVTNASGLAMVTATANTTAGGPYYVTATATITPGSVAGSASYMLTNTAGTSSLTITASGGASQSTMVGTAFTTPLQVTVQDQYNNPVPNATVTFTVPGSGASASLNTTTVTTNASGQASVNATANTTAGTYDVTAATSGAATSATFALTNTPGTTGRTITATAGTPQSATVNTAFTDALQVLVKDSYGNPVPNVTVTYTVPGSGASATLNPVAGTATTDATGHASVTATANTSAGAYDVTASAPGASPSATFALTNTAGTGTMTISATGGTTQTTTVNTAFGTALQATVKDQYNNPVPGIVVTFGDPTTGASATLSPLTATTDTNGHASTSATANTAWGTYTVTAVATNASGSATYSLTNTAMTTGLTITATSGTPQSAVVQAAFANALVATVTDQYGNVVPGQTVTFTVPASGASATLAPTSGTTNASGIVTVNATANTTTGAYSVTAATPNAATSASYSLTNTADLSNVTITATAGTPQSATVGTAFTTALEATVRDQHGNAAPGVAVTFTVPASGASTTLGSLTGTTDTNGHVTTAATANTTAGTYAVTAAATNAASSASYSLTNTAGTTNLTMTVTGGTPQSTTVGTAFTSPLQVLVKDQYGNPVPSITITYDAPSSGASATMAATATTNASGAASVTATANTTAGGYTVTAAAPSANGVSFALTNTAGTTSLTITPTSGTPQSQTVGMAFAQPLVATVKDQYNNVVPNIAVTLSVPASGAGATLSTMSTTTDASGQISVTATANTTQGGYTVSANATGAATAASFQLSNTASTTNLTMTATAGTPQSTTVNTAFTTALQATVKDQYNNPVQGIVVTFTPPASGASANLSSLTATTDVSGHATVTATATTASGPYSVIASAPSTTSASFALTNMAGTTNLTISATNGTPQSATIAAAFGQALQATVRDQYGNPVPGQTVTFASPASGASASLSMLTLSTDTNGQVVVNATANTVAGAYSVSASTPNAATATSFSLTNMASLSNLTITATAGSPQSTTVATAFAIPLQATVTDQYHNPVPGVTVTFTAPSSQASASLSSLTAITDASGHAVVSATANTVSGGYAVVASAPSSASASFALTNTAMTTNLTITAAGGSPQSATVGTAFAQPLQVVVKDQYGNVVPSIAVTYAPPASGAGASLSFLTVNTNTSGQASVTATANTTAGAYAVNATAAGAVNNVNFSLTNNPSMSNLTVSVVGGGAQSATIGTAFGQPLQMQVKDQYGNPVPGATITFTAPATGSSAVLSPASVSTDASGNASVGATATMTTGTYGVTATTTGATTNGTFTLTNTKGTPTVGLGSVPNSSMFGQTVTFTATVPPEASGTITFSEGSTTLGTVSIIGGTATLTSATLHVGTHPVTATYSGDSNWYPASSTATNQVVTVATPSLALTASPATVVYGNTTVLTAMESQAGATGTVTFTATPVGGGTPITLGTASLDNTSAAVYPVSSLPVGTYNVVAHYNGDPNVNAVDSNVVQLKVTQRSLTVVVSDATRRASESNPVFSYGVTGQLVNGDTYATAVTGTPAYSSYTGSNTGTYPITITGGLTSANYALSYVAGTLTVNADSVGLPTTTLLGASPMTSTYGDPVALTAVVTPSAATGTISYYDGSTLLGTVSVNGGTTVLTTTSLSAGTHNITARYNGDGTYSSSVSTPVVVTVSKKGGSGPGGAALVLTVQNSSRQVGAADPQFTYVATGALVNGDTYASAIAGVPIYAVGPPADNASSPAGATFAINMSGLSSQNYQIAIVPGTLTIANQASTTTLTTANPAPTYGDSVALTAQVASCSSVGDMVVFQKGPIVIGSAPVNASGQATLTLFTLPAGTYPITATYLGTAACGSSTSNSVTELVAQKALTVTVQDVTRAYGVANPAYTYSVDSTALVNGDTASIAVRGVPAYVAVDGSNNAITITTSAGVYSNAISVAGGLNSTNYALNFVKGKFTINQNVPTVALASSPNPQTYSLPITFTATLPLSTTGTITFMDGSTTLGTATVSNGTATFTTSTLPVGTYNVTAVYSGDTNWTTATSPVDVQTITKATPGDPGIPDVTVASSVNPSQRKQPVTFTATVPPTATGTITFMDGSTVLGTVTIANATATYTTNMLSDGTHPITAVYSGDSNFNPKSSAKLIQTVIYIPLTLTISPTSVTLNPGQSQAFTLTASRNVGLQMVLNSVPGGATLQLSSPTISGPNMIWTATLVTSKFQSASSSSNTVGSVTTLAVLIIIPLIGFRRRVKSSVLTALVALVFLVGVFGLTGCGSTGWYGPSPSKFPVTGTVTSVFDGETASATATVTVQ